jgi:hypothetical protein
MSQRRRSRQRGIQFEFTFDEWLAWWKDALTKRPGHRRGTGKNDLQMCRKGDQGGYWPDNVFAGTPKENWHTRPASARNLSGIEACNAAGGYYKGVRGYGHPKSLACETETGRIYGSISLASEAHGITRQGGAKRVQRGLWRLVVLECV